MNGDSRVLCDIIIELVSAPNNSEVSLRRV